MDNSINISKNRKLRDICPLLECTEIIQIYIDTIIYDVVDLFNM